MNNTIHLPIKRQWEDMIKAGIKKEEYRKLTPYWAKLLLSKKDYNRFVEGRRLGYKESHMKGVALSLKEGKDTIAFHQYRPDKTLVECLGIEVKRPNPAWCPPQTEGLWFALKLGRILETKNIEK